MLGTYKPREAAYIDIRIALPHDGEDGLFFATCRCGEQRDAEMVNAWEGPKIVPLTADTPVVDDPFNQWIDEFRKTKPYREQSDVPDREAFDNNGDPIDYGDSQ